MIAFLVEWAAGRILKLRLEGRTDFPLTYVFTSVVPQSHLPPQLRKVDAPLTEVSRRYTRQAKRRDKRRIILTIGLPRAIKGMSYSS